MNKINDWFPNQIGYDIWNKKYRHNDETLEEWFDRVSGGNDKLRQKIKEKKFLFAGRILANRGLQNEKKITYSNCYVLSSPKDNLESIFETGKELARTFSYGGGCGIDISNLAPKGAKVNNAAKYSTGAVSYMSLYSLITGLIGQDGRRGALMLSINDTHPDLELFIDAKTDLKEVTKANISVRLSDKFMNAVEHDLNWELYFERPESGEKISKIVKAKDIFLKLVENNWNYAEPGILFWDKITNYHLNSDNELLKYEGVNPCSEKPLTAGGSCLLGSINLSEYVTNPFTITATFNIEQFSEDVHIYVKALNEVLYEGLNLHPLKIQRENVNNWRQIGLGLMGLADAFIKLGIRYGNQESYLLSKLIAETLLKESILESANLTEIYGKYPLYKDVTSTKFFKNINFTNEEIQFIKEKGLANAELLSIAPTGSISTMLSVSGAIEPTFALSFNRKTQSLHGKDVVYKVDVPILEEFKKVTKKNELPDYFVTSEEIDYNERILIQSAFQSYIDSSISSTINLPQSSSIEDVYNIYMNGWKSGLKGLTIYRSGCKREGILTTNNNTTPEQSERPKSIPCDIHNVKIEGEQWTIIIGLIDKTPYEVFAFKNRNINIVNVTNSMLIKESKDDKNYYSIVSDNVDIINLPELYETGEEEFITRLISRLVRLGEIKTVLKDAEKTYKNINTFVSVIKRVLSKYVKENIVDELCPECGEPLIMQEGCKSCPSCGYSKCG